MNGSWQEKGDIKPIIRTLFIGNGESQTPADVYVRRKFVVPISFY